MPYKILDILRPFEDNTKIELLGISLILKRNIDQKILEKEINLKQIKEILKKKEDEFNLFQSLLKTLNNEMLLNKIQQLTMLDEQSIIKAINFENPVKSFKDTSTSPSLSELMIRITNIKNKTKILDAYSGVGKIDLHILNKYEDIEIIGYEISQELINIANIRMYANNKKVKYIQQDLLSTRIKETNFDFAVADLPFVSKYDQEVQDSLDKIYKEQNIKISTKISTTWNTAFKICEVLNDNGKAVITTIIRSLFNVLDKDARKYFVDNGYIEAIIELPTNLIPNTGISMCLIILNKNNTSKDIKFVDLKECKIKNGLLNAIDINKAEIEYNTNAKIISYDDIVNHDYDLNLSAYTEKVEIKNGIELNKIVHDIFRGYQITSAESSKMLVTSDDEMNYEILEVSNINEDGEIISDLKKINSSSKNLDRYLLENGDIVISARGENTKKSLIYLEKGRKVIANGSLIVIRPNKEKINPNYLKMFLDSQKGKITLNSIKAGVTIPSINIVKLEKILVPCPSLVEQNKISKKYEKKLDVINSTKKTLHELKNELQKITDSI